MTSLRSRLILSHTLPLLIVLPLMGLVLIYALESQVVLVNLSGNLERQAGILAEVGRDDPALWQDPAAARTFVDRYGARLSARLMLLDGSGRVLVTTDPSEASLVGTRLLGSALAQIQTGQQSVRFRYSQDLQSEIADVWVPVISAEGELLGAVRLSHELATVYGRFQRLRVVVVGVLTGALVVGVTASLALVLTIQRPLVALTESLRRLPFDSRPLKEEGPDEMRVLARTFNALLERQESLRQGRRHLLANVVHELGRPLGALRSAMYALQHGADLDPAFRSELMGGMSAEMARMERVLDDLSGLSGQLIGTLELNQKPTALDPWLDNILGPWREAAQQRGFRWSVERPDPLPTLRIDGDRLGQALGNLLSNAIQHVPPGATITVRAETEGEHLLLRVSDTGPGILPSEHARVFDPFYRSRAHQRVPQGIGIGLSIARGMVEAHGGRLELRSELGQGCEFTIRLPLALALPHPDLKQTLNQV